MASRFSALLLSLRKQAGLTQEELAEKARISVRTIRRLERGDRQGMQTETVIKLADALAKSLGRAQPEVRAELQAALNEAPEPDPAPKPGSGSDTPPSTPPSTSAPNPHVAAQRPATLTDAIASLANELRVGWSNEEDLHRIHDQLALPVCWRTRKEWADHWENITNAPPGTTAVPLVLDGALPTIVQRYQEIPSRRLAVVGRAGSGKTILTLRFALNYLVDRVDGAPVPVIFSISDWNPRFTEFDTWLVHRLLQDHPGLAARVPGGSTLAAELVKYQCILPVLDGFDEISSDLHAEALAKLNAHPKRPLLITCRTEEFHAATEAVKLAHAAVVELCDLSPEDIDDYLHRTANPIWADGHDGHDGKPTTVWDPVFHHLKAKPDDQASINLTTVLSTPLMVALARTIYSNTLGADPTALLDPARFPTAQDLEDHLLAGFVPAAYASSSPPPEPVRARATAGWEPHRAEFYLAHLARLLARRPEGDRQNLAWWHLAGTVRPSARIFVVVLACALITDASTWLVTVPYDLAGGYSLGFIVRACLAEALLVGPAVGLAFGLVYGFITVFRPAPLEPARLRLRLTGRNRRAGGQRGRRYTVWFLVGMGGGMAVGLGYGPAQTLEVALLTRPSFSDPQAMTETLINVLVFGLIFGLAGGLVFGLVAALETPIDIGSATSPVSLLAADRKTVLRHVTVLIPSLALTITLGGMLWVALLQGTLGPLVWHPVTAGLSFGVVGGFAGALSYVVSFTAWGQWLLLARIWLPLTGRLPWRPISFLEDAVRRDVLRPVGAVYQFRHARLQEHLSHRADDTSPVSVAII